MREASQPCLDGLKAMEAEERDRETADQRQVLGSLPRARGARILLQQYVLRPVQPVFDAPVRPDDGCEVFRGEDFAADVETLLSVWLRSSRALAVDRDDAGQVSPLAEGLLRRNREHPCGASRDTVSCALFVDPDVCGRGSRAQGLRRLVELALVPLEANQIVRAGVADQVASFFRQCSASRVTPAPSRSLASSARMASTTCASLPSLLSKA
jgi:hypothetical protein